ncbi:hypothetical protein K435DRAFT_684811, partial [Dendrothele bispora CBS 962.96]
CVFALIAASVFIVSFPCFLPLRTQSLIPLAIAVLHNFIIFHDPPETPAQLPTVRELLAPDANGDSLPTSGISESEATQASILRDQIADAMWTDYLAELDRRGIVHSVSLPNM